METRLRALEMREPQKVIVHENLPKKAPE